MASHNRMVVGVFENRLQAQKAVQELKAAGFRDDQIGVAARDTEYKGSDTEKGSYAEEGAVAGALGGAGVAGLWAIGIAAGVLPAIGPAIAGGLLASLLTSAVAGAAVGGLAGALIGAGIPEEEAHYYESEFKAGRTIVTVKANGRHDEAVAIIRRFGGYDRGTMPTGANIAHTSHTHHTPTMTASHGHESTMHTSHPSSAHAHTPGALEVREERLQVHKEPVQTGEVNIRKEVHTEHKTLDVPVQREEVIVERHDVGSGRPAGAVGGDEQIRVPVTEEHVHVEKQPVVKEEIVVGKRKVTDTEHISEDVRREEAHIDTQGNANVKDKRNKRR